MLLIFYISLVHWTISQELISPYIFFDCKHLILPIRCQCYHSGHESQLRCLRSELHSLPKLPNNMRWNALDFSYNYITSIDNYVFADIYVEKINLKSNYLREIDVTAFDQIKNLKELFLNNNQLKDLQPQALVSPGVTLQKFDLSQNPFHFLDLGEIFFTLPMLKIFSCVSCQLNDTSFYTLLKFSQANLDENNGTLSARAHHYLEILDLSSNNFTTICSNLFDGFYNLIELRLQNNKIFLIDNSFLRSLRQIQSLNLAHNHLENVPKLISHSLKNVNFSSNHFHYLSEYFASHLHAIESIDFDFNSHLNSTSARAFCFLNILTLQQMTFRSNNLLSLNSFSEFLCRAANQSEKSQLIDINNNVHLKCNCSLIQFQKYLNNYPELTCTQQGQDRYYISRLDHWFSNCSFDLCSKRIRQSKINHCNWTEAERTVFQGTCQTKLTAIEEKKRRNQMKLTTTTTIKMTTSETSQRPGNFSDFRNFTGSSINSTLISIKSASFPMKIFRFHLFVVFLGYLLN